MKYRLNQFITVAMLACLAGIVQTSAGQTNARAESPNQVQERASIDAAISEFRSAYSAQRWDSPTVAQQAVTRGDQLQVMVQQYFSVSERACSERFFVNACVDELRQQRRLWQDQVREITHAAKAYLRQTKNSRVSETRNLEKPHERQASEAAAQ